MMSMFDIFSLRCRWRKFLVEEKNVLRLAFAVAAYYAVLGGSNLLSL